MPHHSNFSAPNGMAIFRRGPPSVECKGVWINRDFAINILLYLGNDTRWSHCSYGARIRNRVHPFEWFMFQWLEWPLTQIPRSRYYSTSKNNSKLVQDCIGKPIESGMRSFKRRHYQWLWTQIPRSCHSLPLNILQMVKDTTTLAIKRV